MARKKKMLKEEQRKLFNDIPLQELATLAQGRGVFRNTPKGYNFGVEIEVEGRGLPLAILGWDVHNEGSLRGGGVEYVTHGPVTKEILKALMIDLNRVFEALGAQSNDHKRAATHIHYNMKDKTIRDIWRAVIFETCFEPVLLKLCGPTRDGNLFCMSSYDTGDLPWYIDTWFKEQYSHNNDGGIYRVRSWQRGKYASLNSDPLGSFGSLELRVFPSSIKEENILKWADWTERLMESQKDLNPSTIEMVNEIYKNRRELAEKVFGPEALELSNIESLVGFGCEQAWPVAHKYEQWMGQ